MKELPELDVAAFKSMWRLLNKDVDVHKVLRGLVQKGRHDILEYLFNGRRIDGYHKTLPHQLWLDI